VDSAKLLTRNDLTELFPRAQVFPERFFGFTRSYIVLENWVLTPAEDAAAAVEPESAVRLTRMLVRQRMVE
jgi:hypothetical protein